MMCGTHAHGRLADALAHGGCGHLFYWDSVEPANTCKCPDNSRGFANDCLTQSAVADYIGLDGQQAHYQYAARPAPRGGGVFEVGQQVEARHANGMWYRARIAEVHGDRRRRNRAYWDPEPVHLDPAVLQYTVDWDDGDTQHRRLPAINVRPAR